jgi:hypothetical protein
MLTLSELSSGNRDYVVHKVKIFTIWPFTKVYFLYFVQENKSEIINYIHEVREKNIYSNM